MRAGIRAATRLTVERAAGRQALRWAHGWPVVLRPTGGDERVHLVHAAGGPLGGDDLALSVDVGPGARLAVHSAGATLVQPGAATDAPARWTVELQVGAGARVHWAPEPTVVSDGAGLESTVRVVLAAGAVATVREIVVLGRHGQRGGRYAGTHARRRRRRAAARAHHTARRGRPELCGPAGPAGPGRSGRSCAPGRTLPRCLSGRRGETADVRWAWSALDGPGEVLMAVGTPSAVAAVLDAEGRGAAGAEDRSRGTVAAEPGSLVPAPGGP